MTHESPRPTAGETAAQPTFRLEHIGIAVSELESARTSWTELLRAPSSAVEEVSDERVRLSFLDVSNTRLELLEGTEADSPITRFLERRAPGVHHLSFEVEGVDLDRWFAELRAQGVRLLGEAPRDGADGKRVFFVHPAATGGVLVEFSQPAAGRAAGDASPDGRARP